VSEEIEDTIERERRIATRLIEEREASFRSWIRDLFPLVLLAISGLVWGMKLEARYDKLEERQISISMRIASLEELVSKGILPRSEEKINSLDRRITQVEKDCLPLVHD